jgi:hypothetical protein
MVVLVGTMIRMLPDVAEIPERFQSEEEDGSHCADDH